MKTTWLSLRHQKQWVTKVHGSPKGHQCAGVTKEHESPKCMPQQRACVTKGHQSPKSMKAQCVENDQFSLFEKDLMRWKLLQHVLKTIWLSLSHQKAWVTKKHESPKRMSHQSAWVIKCRVWFIKNLIFPVWKPPNPLKTTWKRFENDLIKLESQRAWVTKKIESPKCMSHQMQGMIHQKPWVTKGMHAQCVEKGPDFCNFKTTKRWKGNENVLKTTWLSLSHQGAWVTKGHKSPKDMSHQRVCMSESLKTTWFFQFENHLMRWKRFENDLIKLETPKAMGHQSARVTKGPPMCRSHQRAWVTKVHASAKGMCHQRASITKKHESTMRWKRPIFSIWKGLDALKTTSTRFENDLIKLESPKGMSHQKAWVTKKNESPKCMSHQMQGMIHQKPDFSSLKTT